MIPIFLPLSPGAVPQNHQWDTYVTRVMLEYLCHWAQCYSSPGYTEATTILHHGSYNGLRHPDPAD